MRCLVASEVDCQSAAVVATGNERSLQLIPVCARTGTTSSFEKHDAMHVGHRRRGHSRRRQTNGQVESPAGRPAAIIRARNAL